MGPLLPVFLAACCLLAGALGQAHLVSFDMRVPDFDVTDRDAYVCVASQLPPKPHKLVGVVPRAQQEVVHHILLFGCVEPAVMPKGNATVAWRCDHQPVCAGGSNTILYGWGRNAPELILPEGVGFSVGHGTSVQYIVAQVHYLDPKPKNDHSGVTLMLKPHAVPYSGGLIAFASMFTIPPGQPDFPVRNRCCYKGHQPLTTFGVRVHTHVLGKTVFMDRDNWNHTGKERLVERSPQLPQAFVPVPAYTLWPGDSLNVECDFDSTSRSTMTSAGPTAKDEMCNMYVMVYAPHPYVVMCDNGIVNFREENIGSMPLAATMQLDPSPFWHPPLPQSAPAPVGGKDTRMDVGDATAVAVAPDGSVWVLYRASRTWGIDTFDFNNKVTAQAPIKEACVLQLEPETGHVKQRWGAGVFWMPHSITLDREGNVWITDVGRHQVLKFSPSGKLLLEVGTKLQPGNGKDHFCKPAGITVLRDLSFVVTDGYCNSRLVRFDASGKFMGEGAGPLQVAHGVVVDECDNRAYAVSREDGKVLTFELGTLKYMSPMQDASKHGKAWSVKMGPYGEPLLLAYEPGKPARIINLLMPNEVWELPGTENLSPHDFALGPAAVALSGAGDRMFAVYLANVGYTCSDKGCGPLLKYVLVPNGHLLPDPKTLQPFVIGAVKGMAHGSHNSSIPVRADTGKPAAQGPAHGSGTLHTGPGMGKPGAKPVSGRNASLPTGPGVGKPAGQAAVQPKALPGHPSVSTGVGTGRPPVHTRAHVTYDSSPTTGPATGSPSAQSQPQALPGHPSVSTGVGTGRPPAKAVPAAAASAGEPGGKGNASDGVTDSESEAAADAKEASAGDSEEEGDEQAEDLEPPPYEEFEAGGDEETEDERAASAKSVKEHHKDISTETYGIVDESPEKVAAESRVSGGHIAAMVIGGILCAGLVAYAAVAMYRKYSSRSGYAPVSTNANGNGYGGKGKERSTELNTLESIIANAEAEVEAGMYVKKGKGSIRAHPHPA